MLQEVHFHAQKVSRRYSNLQQFQQQKKPTHYSGLRSQLQMILIFWMYTTLRIAQIFVFATYKSVCYRGTYHLDINPVLKAQNPKHIFYKQNVQKREKKCQGFFKYNVLTQTQRILAIIDCKWLTPGVRSKCCCVHCKYAILRKSIQTA